jgi:hypothetical protein
MSLSISRSLFHLCAREKNMDNGMAVGKAFTSSCCSVPEAVLHKTR